MLALATGIAFTSCEDKLDIPQKASVTINSFYENDEDCEQALASAYAKFLKEKELSPQQMAEIISDAKKPSW